MAQSDGNTGKTPEFPFRKHVEQVDPRIKRALEELTYTETGWRLDEMARRIGLSSSRLQHLFKLEIGISMQAFSSRVRLHFAAIELADMPLSSKEIRLRCGYSDSSNFTHAFGSHFGCSPTQFRLLHGTATTESRSREIPTDCGCAAKLIGLVSALYGRSDRGSGFPDSGIDDQSTI